MVQKKRYFKKEEQLLRELKSAHPNKSWDTIAEIYNVKVGDESRFRTGLALQLKFKKMQAHVRRLTKKGLGQPSRCEWLPDEGRLPQDWTVPASLQRWEVMLSGQCMSQSWVTPSEFLLAVPGEGIEYEVSLLQWHLGTMLDDLCTATASVLASFRN